MEKVLTSKDLHQTRNEGILSLFTKIAPRRKGLLHHFRVRRENERPEIRFLYTH